MSKVAVPAAKLARREGLDVILDPLWGTLSPSLHEHIDGLRTQLAEALARYFIVGMWKSGPAELSGQRAVMVLRRV